jgi:hypothetical protein
MEQKARYYDGDDYFCFLKDLSDWYVLFVSMVFYF